MKPKVRRYTWMKVIGKPLISHCSKRVAIRPHRTSLLRFCPVRGKQIPRFARNDNSGWFMTVASMKILLFGASGSAGGAVLFACLFPPGVQEGRALVPPPPPRPNPKPRTVLPRDFPYFSPFAPA